MVVVQRSIVDFFDTCLDGLSCEEPTRNYIVSLLSSAPTIPSSPYLVLYAHAVDQGRFEQFQQVADAILWTTIAQPEAIDRSMAETATSVARLSYYTCFRLLRGRWRLYEELADRFHPIARDARERLWIARMGSSIRG